MNSEDLKITDMIRPEETSALIRGIEEAFRKLMVRDNAGMGAGGMVVLSAELYNGEVTDMTLAEIPAPLLETFAEDAAMEKSYELFADAYGREVMTNLVEINPFFFTDCMLPTSIEDWSFSIPAAVCALYYLPDGSYQGCFRLLCAQGKPEYRGFLIQPDSKVPNETAVPVWVSRFLDGAVDELPKVQQPEWGYSAAA